MKRLVWCVVALALSGLQATFAQTSGEPGPAVSQQEVVPTKDEDTVRIFVGETVIVYPKGLIERYPNLDEIEHDLFDEERCPLGQKAPPGRPCAVIFYRSKNNPSNVVARPVFWTQNAPERHRYFVCTSVDGILKRIPIFDLLEDLEVELQRGGSEMYEPYRMLGWKQNKLNCQSGVPGVECRHDTELRNDLFHSYRFSIPRAVAERVWRKGQCT